MLKAHVKQRCTCLATHCTHVVLQSQIVLTVLNFFTLLFFGSCPANFTGARCEADVDECLVLSNLCKNGATCTNFVGGYTCRCINGWEGVDCATNTDDCLTQDGSSKCLHGGTCIDNVGKFDCVCTPNYTGKLYSLQPRSSVSHQINHTQARIT